MNCLGIARKICLVSGSADCKTRLSAFDAALFDSGIYDYNLITVSSIIPKGCKVASGFNENVEKGSFVPVVLACAESSKKGERIAAAVGAAMFESGIGMVAESSGANTTAARLRAKVKSELELMAKTRKTRVKGKIKFVSAEHTVKECGCALAAAVYVF